MDRVMSEEEIRAAVRRALTGMRCDCYDDRTLEYGPNYPCPKCDLGNAVADLDCSVIQVGAR